MTRARSRSARAKLKMVNFKADAPTLHAIDTLVGAHGDEVVTGGKSHSIRKGLQLAAAQIKGRE